MTGSLEILKPGLMTSIQDMGRGGQAYYAIPNSGVMDRSAARVALLLLHQPESNPIIECTSIAPHIRFHESTNIVVTGADFNWTVNDQAILRNQVIPIEVGDVLKGGFTKDGLRGYIALDGQLVANSVFGSYATYTNAAIGGNGGRLLAKGDTLKWKPTPHDEIYISVYRGPEFDLLSDLSQLQLSEHLYTIGADSNRMGARLRGASLTSSSYQLEYSSPVLPGFIQLPPSGLPIVVLQDGQTTGGYPRIAYIRPCDLSLFNQIPLGGSFKFKLEN